MTTSTAQRTAIRRTTLLQQVAHPQSLNLAFTDVRRAGGAPGVDGVSLEHFAHQLDTSLQSLSQELTFRTYQPEPVRRVSIPKPNGGSRAIGIPTVRDRIVARSIQRVLTPRLEQVFCSHSFAYRPGRNCRSAIARVLSYLRAGATHVVLLDIRDYFPSIQRDLLLSFLEETLDRDPLIDIIARQINSGAGSPDAHLSSGIEQGSPLSPLLSNMYLHPWDRWLNDQNLFWVRYCDNALIACTSEAAARLELDRSASQLQRLGLELNPTKTGVYDAQQGFPFLGFHVSRAGIGPEVLALERLRTRLLQLADEDGEKSPPERVQARKVQLRGWLNYYASLQAIPLIDAYTLAAALEIAHQHRQNGMIRALLRSEVPELYRSDSPDWDALRQVQWALAAIDNSPSGGNPGFPAGFSTGLPVRSPDAVRNQAMPPFGDGSSPLPPGTPHTRYADRAMYRSIPGRRYDRDNGSEQVLNVPAWNSSYAAIDCPPRDPVTSPVARTSMTESLAAEFGESSGAFPLVLGSAPEDEPAALKESTMFSEDHIPSPSNSTLAKTSIHWPSAGTDSGADIAPDSDSNAYDAVESALFHADFRRALSLEAELTRLDRDAESKTSEANTGSASVGSQLRASSAIDADSCQAAPTEAAISRTSQHAKSEPLLRFDESPRVNQQTLALLMGLFRGDPVQHARMWVDRLGRRGYAPVRAPLDAAAWQAHLRGECTLALMLSDGGRFHTAVIDIDLTRPEFERVKGDLPALLHALRQTHEFALRVHAIATRRGISAAIEDSGQKGRHVWIFFEVPATPREAFRLLQLLVQEAGRMPTTVAVDLIPADSSAARAGSPLVTLPLGIHLQTGRRSVLLEPDGEVVERLENYLRHLRRCHPLEVLSRSFTPATEHDISSATMDARVNAVLKGCPVAEHLLCKAEDINHLNHRERLTLLHVFGHLGPEGADYLHRVMRVCSNYDPRITDQYLAKIKPSPVSCARIREWLPDVTRTVPCCCRFDVPAGLFPSPLLHLLPEIHR